MLRLGLVGTSIHRAPVELLSALTLAPDDRDRQLRELARVCEFDELVYLATCNRVEFVFVPMEARPLRSSRNRILDFFFREGPEVPFQPDNFYLLGGMDAARHLFNVSSALDSLVVGEGEILGQVRDAFAEARRLELVGSELNQLFQRALHCARKVRRDTRIGARRVSVVNLALDHISDRVRERPGMRVAIVGTGPMTNHLAGAFREYGVERLYFVNRTVSKAELLARQYRGEAVSLEMFLKQPPAVDAVCTATSAPHTLFGKDETRRLLDAGQSDRPFLFVDLAVPRDVTDDVEEFDSVTLCHIGTLSGAAQKNRRERFREADRARDVIEEEVSRYYRQVIESSLSPLLGDSHDVAHSFAESGLETLLKGRLRHLSDTDKEAIRYWVMTKLVPHVLHLPMKAIAESANARSSDDELTTPESGGGGVIVHGLRLARESC